MPSALFGIVRLDGGAVDDRDIAALSARLSRWGTHETVCRPDPAIAVGRRSPAPAGDREAGEDRRAPTVLFDGRLDRAGDPRRAIAAAVERWGAFAFGHLGGDGAFVHVDARRRRLVLSVDHVGTSPVYWARPARGLVAFAPAPAILPGICGISGDLDEAHLVDWVTALEPAPEATFLRAVRRLPSGHALTVGDGDVRLVRWWRFEARPARWATEAAVTALRAAVADAVERRLPVTGPLAAELSGGLDSSAITALAARCQRGRGREVLAFTYAPAVDPGWAHFDEVPFARAVTEALGPHVERVAHVVLRTKCAPAPRPARLVDDPLDAETVIASFTRRSLGLAGLAGATVILSGWGGDQIVTDHAAPALPAMFLSGAWRPLWRDLRRAPAPDPVSRRVVAARFSRTGAHALASAARVRSPLGDRVVRSAARQDAAWYSARCCLRPDVLERFEVRRRLHAPDRAVIDLGHRQRQALESRLLSNRIEREHRMALSAGVEPRYPLLDRYLLELAGTIPPALWHREGRGRWLFREAVRGVLPESVRQRGDKLGGTSDGFRSLARARDHLIARAEVLRDNASANRMFDVASLHGQLMAVPDEMMLRGLPGHGCDHPSLRRTGALLRAFWAAELLVAWGSG